MLNAVTQFPVWVCTTGMAIVVGCYVLFGGFRSVLATDVIQATIMFILIFILFAAYVGIPDPASATSAEHVLPPIGEAAPLLLLGFFAVLGGADVWQRVFSGKNDREVRKGLLLNAAAWLVFGLIVVLIAFGIQGQHPDADPNKAFFLLLSGDLPGWLSAMLALLLFSAVLSTADTELFVLSVMANKEINRITKGEISPRVTRISILVIVLAVAVVAFFVDQLLDIYFVILYFMMILGPIALARLLGRGRTRLAILGIAGGVATLVALIVFERLAGAYQLLIIVPSLLAFAAPAAAASTERSAS